MKLRAYYNASNAFPLCWSIDAGSPISEILCESICVQVPMRTALAGDGESPSGWLAGDGVALIREGRVWIVSEDVADAIKAGERCEWTRLFARVPVVE